MATLRFPLLIGVVSITTSIGSAQSVWVSKESLGQTPSTRNRLAIAYDSIREETVLYGGWTSSTPLAGTYVFDGVRWTQRVPATDPGNRFDHAMAFDRGRGVTVLFGGQVTDRGPAQNDTWEWDGTGWRSVVVSLAPPARAGHGLAYDPIRQRVLLFGGYTSGGPYLDDTWEWDGISWTQLSPTVHPPTRAAHGMCSDLLGGRVLMFGGFSSTLDSVGTNQLWAWDGSTWTQVATPASPPPRGWGRIAADFGRQSVVLVGGYSASATLADTWLFDGITWTRGSDAPAPVLGHGAAFDERRRTVVSMGGAGAFRTSVFTAFPAVAVSYGVGCGVPAPSLGANSRPFLGNGTFVMSITQAATAAPTALLLSGGLGSGLIGACVVHIDPLHFIAAIGGLTDVQGVASFPTPIPPAWASAGTLVFAQGAVVALSGVLTTTPGLSLALGH